MNSLRRVRGARQVLLVLSVGALLAALMGCEPKPETGAVPNDPVAAAANEPGGTGPGAIKGAAGAPATAMPSTSAGMPDGNGNVKK